MKTEILSPAGNFEKLEAAINFGADACYLAGKTFGMRTAADNFTPEELQSAVNLAHSKKKRLYITVNVMPHGDEYGELENYLGFLNEIGADALIISDLGVLEAAKRLAPKCDIHISTQASVVSARSAEMYGKLGARRIVLARELTLDEIRALRRDTSKEIETEAFVHGSMCISWSGRCLLSNHFTGRDANRGACTQPCRWNYKIFELEEEKRPGERMPVEETDRGTFIMSSKDMCMIEHVPELMDAGIDSFKIEGRMKSAYYTAVTANTYKMAVESALSGKYEYDPMWMKELESVSHREYCTGFYYGQPCEDANTVTKPGYVRDASYVGKVDRAENGRAYLRQRNKISVGEEIQLLTPGKTGRSFRVTDMRDAEGNPIGSCPHPLMEYSVPVPFEVKTGDMLRKISEENE